MRNFQNFDRRMMAEDAGVFGVGVGGSSVATTQDYVNAYTGASEPFDATSTMAPAAKERAQGSRERTRVTSSAPRRAESGSTRPVAWARKKLRARLSPSRSRGRDTAAPSG